MTTELKKQEKAVPAAGTTFRRPHYRVNGSKEVYTVEVFMPGVAKDDYKVSLHQDELLVEGKKVIPLPTGAKWLHREIAPQSYQLRLQLNVDINPDAITAKSDNGILTISLPVAEAARPRNIEIN